MLNRLAAFLGNFLHFALEQTQLLLLAAGAGRGISLHAFSLPETTVFMHGYAHARLMNVLIPPTTSDCSSRGAKPRRPSQTVSLNASPVSSSVLPSGTNAKEGH